MRRQEFRVQAIAQEHVRKSELALFSARHDDARGGAFAQRERDFIGALCSGRSDLVDGKLSPQHGSHSQQFARAER
jgi:hypothetical protein